MSSSVVWAVQIENRSLDEKLVDVTATRTEGDDVRTYTLPGVSAKRVTAATHREVATKLSRMQPIRYRVC